LDDGDDLEREDRCPDCAAPRKVYTERQVAGSPMRSYVDEGSEGDEA
jgi:hypothetical protein